MPSQDPAQWFEDLNVHIDEDQVLAYAAELEPAVLPGGSEVGLAAWTIAVSMVAAAFGGLALGGAVWSSLAILAAYLFGAGLFLRFIPPLTTQIVGAAGAWPVLFTAFWALLLAMTAVGAGHIGTPWLGHTVAIAGGAFIGLMFMSLKSSFATGTDVWLMAALPLGAFAAWSAASLQRAFESSGQDAWWPEAFTGTMAASVFVVPLSAAAAIFSTRARGLAKMATLYLHNERFVAKAVGHLDEAITLSPRSADLYNLRGIAHSKAGNGDLADADFAKVTELSPRAAEAHMNRGVDFLRQGEFDRAIEALTQAARTNPKLPTVFSNLGTAHQKKGELDAAIDSYGRAIELRPKYPVAFANRSYSHFLKGDHDLAIADARRALTLDARLPMAHTNLGHALAATGDIAAAARSYRRALTLSPDRSVEEETLEALEKLGVSDFDEDDEARDEDE